MTSMENNSNIYKNHECNIYTFNEHNVIISLDRDDVFINAITSQLSEHFETKLTSKNVVLCKLPDVEISFKEMCRTCLTTTNIKYIFDTAYEGTLISNLLMECASISVQENDIMPKHICDTCISKLINCYLFKKKCLQSQHTLEEIIKYSNTRQGTCWNDNEIQIPFLLHNLECITFVPNDKIEEQEVVQAKNCKQQETTILASNITEILNESIVKEENEATTQNSEEETGDATDLLLNDMSDIENENMKEQIKHELPLSCIKCSKIFKTLEGLEKHHKEVQHPYKRRKLTCQICGKLYARPQLEIHMRTHTKEKPFKCKICSKAFSTKNNLKRHFMIHTGEKPHICHICGKGYIQARSLGEHMCVHTGQKLILCDVCGKGFTQGKSFSEHKCIRPSNKMLKCKYCGMMFSQRLTYRNHMQCHQLTNGNLDQQVKEFLCVVCQKVFLSRNTLKTHMLLHGEKTYLCNECGKGFHIYAGLLSHMKVHTGEKPYSCSECGKCFSQLGSLKAHALIHSGQKPYNCEICLKRFTQKTHLRYHIRTHSGEKPYKCLYCNKRFAIKGSLTVHIRTHTGETPYICDECGKGFHDSSSMKRHKRGHDEKSSVKT